MRVLYALLISISILSISCNKQHPEPVLPNLVDTIYVNEWNNLIVRDSLVGYFVGDTANLDLYEKNAPMNAKPVGYATRRIFYDLEFFQDGNGVRHYPNASQDFTWYLEEISRYRECGIFGAEAICYWPYQRLHIIDTVAWHYSLDIYGQYFINSGYKRLTLVSPECRIISYYDSIKTKYEDYSLSWGWAYEVFNLD